MNGDGDAADQRRPAQRWALVAFVVFATFLTRLPQLTGPHLLLDGDEAVLSLMARRAARFEGFPLYFDGQKYGFSSLETASVALHYLAFGASAVTLKIATLWIWIAGAVALCFCLVRAGGMRAGWIGAVLIVCCPGWGVWSMEARGGYVTAFLFAALFRLTLACEAAESPGPVRRRTAFAAALFATGAAIAQPIWFLALAPMVGVFAWRQRRYASTWLSAFAGAGLIAFAVVLPGLFHSGGSWSPSLMNATSIPAALSELPGLLVRGFAGASYLRYSADRPPFNVVGIIWLAAACLISLRVVFAPGPRATAQRASLVGAVLVAGFAMPTLTPRYLLPVMEAVIFALALQAANAAPRWRSELLPAALILSGTLSLWSFRELVFAGDHVEPSVPSEAEALDEALALLSEHNVAGVYTLDPLLQWIVIDRSEERLPARWKAAQERTPIYIDRLHASASSGGRSALLAYFRQRAVLEATGRELEINEVSGRYLVVFDPPPELLEDLGFE